MDVAALPKVCQMAFFHATFSVKVRTFAQKRCWMWCLEHRNYHFSTPLATKIVSFFVEKYEKVCLLKLFFFRLIYKHLAVSYLWALSLTRTSLHINPGAQLSSAPLPRGLCCEEDSDERFQPTCTVTTAVGEFSVFRVLIID